MLFVKGFKLPLWKYWLPWLWQLFLVACALVVTHMVITSIQYIERISQGWGEWMLCAAMVTAIQACIAFVFLLIGTSGMRDFVRRIIIKILK